MGNDIATVEFGWPVGMPLTRTLGDGLHEVRFNITKKRIARVIFYKLPWSDGAPSRLRQKDAEDTQGRPRLGEKAAKEMTS